MSVNKAFQVLDPDLQDSFSTEVVQTRTFYADHTFGSNSDYILFPGLEMYINALRMYALMLINKNKLRRIRLIRYLKN